MNPLLLAAACVDIAAEYSKEASVIYQEIIDAWDRPDCQALLSLIRAYSPLDKHRHDHMDIVVHPYGPKHPGA